ncbi:serine hydrolase [Streptomyces sp. NPDC058953]|uniref:serine hydrolase n=1 Tax=unclassified Streptomyces TaxID=2593676 RepID=UPI00369E8D43
MTRRRTAMTAALAAAALVPTLLSAAPAAAAAPQVTCVSKKPGLATKLVKDINAALKGRKSTTAIYLSDRTTGTTCQLRGTTKFDSASIVKSTVLAALLHDADRAKRNLTTREKSLAKAMITKSDNNSTTTLWKQLGTTKIQRFLTAAGMTQTVPGKNGYWGLTQITARDQQILLSRLTDKNTLLKDSSRAYALQLMRDVVSSQRWGTPAGAPSSATVQVKNGWLPRKSNGWRVHSIGAFTGRGHNYSIVVLTHDNKTMQDGVNTIQAVSRAIHKDVSAKATARGVFVPTGVPHESVPATPELGPLSAIPARS